MQQEVRKLLEFFTFCGQLKELERFRGQVFWRDYPIEQYESVADHTWRMALILMVIADKLQQPIDTLKAMKMTLIHDLPEIICGDPSPLGSDGTGKDSHAYDLKKAEQKFLDEDKAARGIFNKLGEPLAAELYELWLEFEQQETFEAQVVKAIDKFEGKLQAMEYTCNLDVPKAHLDFSVSYGAKYYEIDPLIEQLGQSLVAELQTNFEKRENNNQNSTVNPESL